jgi:hypothetical protein
MKRKRGLEEALKVFLSLLSSSSSSSSYLIRRLFLHSSLTLAFVIVNNLIAKSGKSREHRGNHRKYSEISKTMENLSLDFSQWAPLLLSLSSPFSSFPLSLLPLHLSLQHTYTVYRSSCVLFPFSLISHKL